MKPSKNILTIRQQCCVSIAALFAVNRRREASLQLKKFLSVSAFSTLFLEELFFHLSLVLGFPAMLEGLEFVRTIRPDPKFFRSKKHSGNSAEGKKILSRIYGDQTGKLLRNIGAIHKDARSIIVHDVYGKVFSRPGLTLRERELINVAVLAIQGLDRQLYSHLRGCLRIGIKPDAIREALSLAQRMSKRRMRTAERLLQSVVSQRKK